MVFVRGTVHRSLRYREVPSSRLHTSNRPSHFNNDKREDEEHFHESGTEFAGEAAVRSGEET